MSSLRTPRRFVTANLPLPEALAAADSPQPEVSILAQDILPVCLLDGAATKWPIYTFASVPANANEPYKLLESTSMPRPHQGANAQFNDLAPGARVPLHRTAQCDFMVLISGEMILGVPAEPYDPASSREPQIRQVRMKPGDVVMQMGTLHYWENPSKTEWARLLGVGLRSVPIEVDVIGPAGDAVEHMVLKDVFDP